MTGYTVQQERTIAAELLPGERILWQGKPDTKTVMHASDLYLIPFSLMWGGFALFWEHAVLTPGKAPIFFELWGVPFVLIGQYLIWGRFIYAAWLKKRVLYVLTDSRVIVVVTGFHRRVITASLTALSSIGKEVRSNGIGTVTFGHTESYGSRQNWGAWDALQLSRGLPVFVDIESASEVAALAHEQRHAMSLFDAR